MWRRSPSRNLCEGGFTYIMLMTAIVLMGVAMSAAARQWKTMVQRELEADLLAKGIEIQRALALYSTTRKAGRVVPGEIYPHTLAELTRMPRPFLRKVYFDPVTRDEWELLRAPTGGIMGVRSKSKSKPIKQREFPPVVRHFEGKPTYYDWVFQHPNPSSTLLIPSTVQPIAGATAQTGSPGSAGPQVPPAPPAAPVPAPPVP